MRTDRGRETMDRLRAVIAEMEADQRATVVASDADWRRAVTFSTGATWGGSIVLILIIGAAALAMSRDHRAKETRAWIRNGHVGLNERLQGEQRLDTLGDNVLTFLAAYLDAPVGAIYLADGHRRYRRFAAYALGSAAPVDLLRPGDGLVGQAAKENRVLHVTDVPAAYLSVASGVGRGDPAELLVAPASVDGHVQAVIELGFFRRIGAPELELLDRTSESLGAAVRASKDRTRLEELLGETQRQAEELQTQQEELRVSNEELEEQSRVLRESQARLENQQSELEQINAQLEEQTQILEHQRDQLGRAQVAVSERAADLERANQYKTEFLANMSHELRTPLNSSLILATLLADNKSGNLTPDQVKFAQTILSAGHDLLALINDVLDLAKIEAGKIEVTIGPVGLAATLDGLGRMFQPMAAQKGIAFDVGIDPGGATDVHTDPVRLGQILRNLLSNAFKFTRQGSVSLRVVPSDPGTVCVVARDTGVGIGPEQQEFIFEAFRQADGSTHRRYGGTGLGLSISRELARLLGGDITVASADGAGSTFTLTLPIGSETEAGRRDVARTALSPRLALAAPTARGRICRARSVASTGARQSRPAAGCRDQRRPGAIRVTGPSHSGD